MPPQHVVRTLAAWPEPGADQGAAPERQLAELSRYLGEILIS
jgi:hypothetical protein